MTGLRALEILLGGSARAHDAEPAVECDVWDELRREIARSRRFDRPFSLLRIEATPARRITPNLRAIDSEWLVGAITYVLLPECARESGEALVARLRRELPETLEDSVVSVAAFPEDGLTSGALLETLRAGCEEHYARRPRERATAGTADASPVHA